ncbi:hypothetical protein DAPPUDRAFT_320342 [Daphnia pulex]|uniref:Uncharacterized protein n=1 Tax=Daphnia pulex TaxID=6669 RepID=E9GPK6_DAPPU|nr:hypothetical protein DAPPUDRAFT_320342 [Daphnia pulex]|eukprot:EFX78661.1 hypothetical protein DAPPUDRAFT_320342 [Daphnia pulex]
MYTSKLNSIKGVVLTALSMQLHLEACCRKIICELTISYFALPFLILFIWLSISIRSFSSTPNPLNGHHLHAIWQCDLLAQDVVPTPQRNEIVDLTTYWYFGDYVFLIPVPDETANINSMIKPFKWPVWLGLRTSIVCAIAVLNLI